MAKFNPRPPLDFLRDSRAPKLISELDGTGVAVLMRENAEALLLEFAVPSRLFNPDRPRRRRRNPPDRSRS